MSHVTKQNDHKRVHLNSTRRPCDSLIKMCVTTKQQWTFLSKSIGQDFTLYEEQNTILTKRYRTLASCVRNTGNDAPISNRGRNKEIA